LNSASYQSTIFSLPNQLATSIDLRQASSNPAILFSPPNNATLSFSPIDQQEESCSNIFSFPQSSQSACSPVVSLLSFPKQPPTPSLNFVYRRNQQLDPNSFSKNIKSSSSSISMISCVSPWCASDHQQFLFSSNQSTQISKLAASF
jgi:hypothetical protein